jgi:hypothetical protein
MKERFVLILSVAACFTSLWLGFSRADIVHGPCGVWNCTGGPYNAYFTTDRAPPTPFDTSDCTVFQGSVYSCAATDSTNCDTQWSCNQLPAVYYHCRGRTSGGVDCWAPFCACNFKAGQ